MKIVAAAVQMPTVPLDVATNLERADGLLRRAHEAGAELAVLPEMFNTGYSHCPDYAPYAEDAGGPTLTHLRARSRLWGMCIAAGFVEHEGRHLYDSLAFVTPDGDTHVYRKRNLVFWEPSRFRAGRTPLVVPTRFGRIGFAICADMIFRRVWRDYRERIDIAVVSAAWPDFADRNTGRKDWLLGLLGPLSGAIPGRVAQDLGIPVVFANQCGPTKTKVPVIQTQIADRFAGRSSVCDGRHGSPALAGVEEEVVLSPVTVHPQRGMKSWRSTFPSAPAASCFDSVRS